MQYYVKRGYSYVNPETGKVTLPGQPLSEAKIDETQKWKLQATELKPVTSQVPTVKKKQTFDEATAAIVEMRDKKTAARREAREAAQRQEIEQAEAEAKKLAKGVKSDSVKKPKPISPDDYIDLLDEGEET